MKYLSDLTYKEVCDIVSEAGMPAYRAEQLYGWIARGASYGQMSNVPGILKERLISDGFSDCSVTIIKHIISAIDGTVKMLYELGDGNVIEGVLMKYKYGCTLCVSTQVGCRMNCAFCASGLEGLIRNLSAGEILGQIIAVNNMFGKDTVTNVVLMGSGEPLDNYDNVKRFLTCVSDPKGLNISKRNVSLSTCGLADKIKLLADEGYTPTLTISLHAPDDEIRSRIMPVNKAYPISTVMEAARYYFNKTGRRVIFEYSMIKGVNDSYECAVKLSELLRGLSCHVNLIALNYVKERGLAGTERRDVEKFMDMLKKRKVSVTLRRSMGSDIEGACGQLRRKFVNKDKEGNKD